MSMAILGRAPSSKRGELFGCSLLWWRPHADYFRAIAPEICEPCKDWYSNDEDGLEEGHALALARVLKEHVETGKTLAYQRICMGDTAPTRTVPCSSCTGGTPQSPRDYACWLCGGKGFVEEATCDYPFDVEFVENFIEFLMDCGGFRIC